MEPNESNEPDRRSSPGMAKLITVAVLAMAGYSVVATKHLDPVLGSIIGALGLAWMGHGVDRFLGGR